MYVVTLIIVHCLSYTAPSAPLNVTALAINPTSVMVTWQPPLIPNGIIRSYQVEVSDSGSGFTNTSVDVDYSFDGATNSAVISMLDENATYLIQVFAVTVSIGQGSDIIIVTTEENSKLCFMLLSYCI